MASFRKRHLLTDKLIFSNVSQTSSSKVGTIGYGPTNLTILAFSHEEELNPQT